MSLICWLRIVVCCVGAVFAATAGRANPIESSTRVGFGHDLPGPKDAAFYRMHARPASGPVQTLEAKLWALETDLKSRLAYPRLISLADGTSVAHANAALQMIHGRILRTEAMYRRELTKIPLFRNHEEFDAALWLDPVKVTYLSTRFAAVVAIGGQITEGNATPVHVLGAGIDIRHGTIFTVASCRDERDGPFFTFGALLTICDNRKLDAFQALRFEQARIVQDAVPRRAKQPGEDCRSLAAMGIDPPSPFSVYPMPRGLAVHTVMGAGGWEERCTSDPDRPFFPTIIPWAKLAPLMNPGPWRDELLSLH